MLTLLYIGLIVQIVSAAIMFFLLLGNSVIYAVAFTALAVLGMIPTLVLIRYVEKLDILQEDFYRLQTAFKRFAEKANGEPAEKQRTSPPVTQAETARGVWECVKCGTVNKAGSAHCAGCKADYSPDVNPTDSPYQKKKVSRWIK